MSTKVKGNKIKEGSIPFNALAPLNDTDKNQALANLGIDNYIKELNKKFKILIKHDEISMNNPDDPNLITGYGDGLDALVDNIKTFIANCIYYNITGMLEFKIYHLPCCSMALTPYVFDGVSVNDIKTKIEGFTIIFGLNDAEASYTACQIAIRLYLGQLYMTIWEI